jgi:FtsP/CotA-like multicopper oxidase with cupredoxin domain
VIERKYLVLAVLVILASGLAVAALLLPSLNKTTTTTSSTLVLPPGCVKPAGGFLIVASELGYNDSADHGVPTNSWPVMNVHVGQNVTIVVCNADPDQPHGFQVTHYYDSRLVSLGPGQVLTVNFIASESGTFRVYCNIFCTVHWAMQSGALVVS